MIIGPEKRRVSALNNVVSGLLGFFLGVAIIYLTLYIISFYEKTWAAINNSAPAGLIFTPDAFVVNDEPLV